MTDEHATLLWKKICDMSQRLGAVEGGLSVLTASVKSIMASHMDEPANDSAHGCSSGPVTMPFPGWQGEQ